MKVARSPYLGPVASVDELAEHLSETLLWAIVKNGGGLNSLYVQHTKECRDCRELVHEFSRDARSSGLSFRDLLPNSEER